jgi:hypothetical protein
MKTRLIAISTALTLAAALVLPAHADTSDSAVTPAWQEPGYVMEIVVVTAKRPKLIDPELTTGMGEAAGETADAEQSASEEVELAWQQPGYVQEVVVVTASRSEVLANARRAIASRWIDARPRY